MCLYLSCVCVFVCVCVFFCVFVCVSVSVSVCFCVCMSSSVRLDVWAGVPVAKVLVYHQRWRKC